MTPITPRFPIVGILMLLGSIAFGFGSSAAIALEREEARSSVDLSQAVKPGTVVNLSKDWEFYWNSKIEPSQELPPLSAYINAASWNGQTMANGEVLGAFGFGTYRKILRQIPFHPEGYQIGVRGIASSFKFMIYPLDKPELLQHVESGRIDPQNPQGSRKTAYLTLNPAVPTDYVVLLQVGNQETPWGGPTWPIEIATGHTLQHAVKQEGLINIIGLGIMLAVGIYSFMMWWRRRGDQPALALAVVSFAAFMRIASTSNFIIDFFPAKAFELLLKFEFMSMPLGVGSYLAFLVASFQADEKSWTGRILIPFHVALCVLTILTPVRFFTAFLPIYQLAILATGIAYLWLLGRSVWKRQSGAVLVLSGCLLIVASFVLDIVIATLKLDLIMVTPLAVSVFLILQSQLVALRAAQTYERSERLAGELQVKNEEITYFNKNLEKLVDLKTKEIRSLLDHIPQGVCTIGEETLVQKDYSAQLIDVLGTKDIAGKTVKELLLDRSTLSEDVKDQVVQTLLASIGESIFNFDTNADKLPAEIAYKRGDRLVYLKATWNTEVDEDDNVGRILLTLLDVTNEKALEMKAKEQGRQLQMIRELLEASPERLAQFFLTARPMLLENQKLIRQGSQEPSIVRLLFVNAHTVKGAARTLQLKALAEVIHVAEDNFSHLLKGQSVTQEAMEAGNSQAIQVLEQYIEINREKLNRKEDLSKISIDRSFLERAYFILHDLVQEENPRVEQILEAIRHHRDALTEVIFEKLDTVLGGYQERASKIAKDIGKPEPRFEVVGGDLTVSQEIRAVLDNCMTHILRNALDHGIETAEERSKVQKNPAGSIRIEAKRESDQLKIRIQDDGRGLALKKLKEKGVGQGLISADADLPRIAQLIFATGLSTADKLSNISGRGVGMDAVKEFLEKAGGGITIELGAERSPGFQDFALVLTIPYQKGSSTLAKAAA